MWWVNVKGVLSQTSFIGEYFGHSNLLVRCILLVLLFMSVFSWAVIFNRYFFYRNLSFRMKRFEKIFWSGKSLEELEKIFEEEKNSGKAAIFLAAMSEWKKSFLNMTRQGVYGTQERVEKMMQVALSQQEQGLFEGLSFLAIIASSAPFIGLLGTVIGIVEAFQQIAAQKNASLIVVAPAISEALVATAFGLFVAIPAVIFYNRLLAKAQSLIVQMEDFLDVFSTILSRQIDNIDNENH